VEVDQMYLKAFLDGLATGYPYARASITPLNDLLASDFELTERQADVITSALLSTKIQGRGHEIEWQRSITLMTVVNFITLNCRRIQESQLMETSGVLE